MSTVIEQVNATTSPEGADRAHWVVEFNIAGCRINRWAQKRRHLLVLSPRSFSS